MSNHSFFTYKGYEQAKPGFEDRAMALLSEHHTWRFSLEVTQMFAWHHELTILAPIAEAFPDCTISLEYMIPRMGKRVDAIVLIDGFIFVLEFKIGETGYPSNAINQVADYAYDLKNFHSMSHDKKLFPVLICSMASNQLVKMRDDGEGIYSTQLANTNNLLTLIKKTIDVVQPAPGELDHDAWLNATYHPTPTIIEAAQALYHHNKVEDISRHAAGHTNINETTDCVNALIEKSRANGRKSICFITGVPGAGKTLVGLNIASKRRLADGLPNDETAVFLSGNGPLIEVLQAALVEDQLARNAEECRLCEKAGQQRFCKGCSCKKPKYMIQAEVHTFVQGVHLFREGLFTTDCPPSEHIAIFDEAQRAWTKEWLTYKMKNRWQNKREVNKSEPQCLIEYMDRHQDWACMICLVGGGQEINQGEAGIIEWFKALHDHFPDWDVYVSGSIESENYLNNGELLRFAPQAKIIDGLHLSVDMRSFRNVHVAAFAEALVSNQPECARELYKDIEADYPIYVTRDLSAAKDWVRSATKRPSDRYGIVADSYGQRIRADGIIVPMEFNAVKWFLRGKEDVDSSYFMEIAASEFKIQGLEIDYAIVAWEGDYRYSNGSFEYHRFYGGEWRNVNAEMPRRYLKNGYRVLLTRARQGYVIYVPSGSDLDPTRPSSYYDETYRYLKSAGIKELPAVSNK